ncbi:hypothetical protein F5Y05DRAFT_419487 [Hypoxylon sp. FL0543]|nr:hypothetical protein F5Y05DRAFT_419487 [Hypoxylon sp. FL0543]
MASHNRQGGDKADTFAININPERPLPWTDIVAIAMDYIKCHQGCFDDITTPRKRHRNGHSGKQRGSLVQSQVTAQTPPPSSLNNAGRPIGSALLNLPKELFFQILQWVAGGPYELEATLCCQPDDPLLLMFAFTRSWKSIQTFHVCRAFRTAAIKLYGRPNPNSIPFNPGLDKVVISKMDNVEGIDLKINPKGSWGPTWYSSYHNDPLYKGNGYRCYNIVLNLPGVLSPRIWAIPDLFSRITHMDFTAFSKPPRYRSRCSQQTWACLFGYFSALMPNLRSLGISVCNYDDCAGKRAKPRPDQLFRARETWLLEGLRMAILHKGGDELPLRLFPNLGRLTISKLKPRCSGWAFILPISTGGDSELLFLGRKGDDGPLAMIQG